ncbi:MAG: hypothetical protein LAO07_20885, partial [Acidobacteriia bacterium]|nr:hypothetical protein [Terriglobia bacterium]
MPDFLAQARCIEALLRQFLLELFPGVRTLQFVDLGVDLRLRDGDVGLRGVGDKDLVVDELIQDVQFETQGLLLTGRIGARGHAGAIVSLHLIAVDGFAIHLRPHAAIRRCVARTAGERDERSEDENCPGAECAPGGTSCSTHGNIVAFQGTDAR